MRAITLYQVGLAITALFGVGHFTGFVQAVRAARRDPEFADLTRAMRAKTTRVMGFEASILDFREYFSLNFSILLWTSALLGWAALGLAADPAQAARLLSGIYALGMILLLATSIRFHVAQGIVTCGLLVAIFGFGAWIG